MPYIMKHRRDNLQTSNCATTPGELTYLFTQAIIDYLGYEGTSYHSINGAIGALECAKLELYRRIAAPFEDRKIKENGDVY